jgi:hypothetical protein
MSWSRNFPQFVKPCSHKSLPVVFILSQISPVYMLQTYLSYFNIILPPTSRSTKSSLSFRFPYLTSHVFFYRFYCVLCYMSCQSEPPSYDRLFNTEQGIQIMKLLVVQFLQPCFFLALRPKYLLQCPILKWRIILKRFLTK